MGRWVEVWGLDYQRIQTQCRRAFLPFLKALAQRMDWSEQAALEQLERLTSAPQQAHPEEWSDLRFVYADATYGKGNKHPSFDEIGFVRLLETSATNPSCVFMEQFFDWRTERQIALEGAEDGYSYQLPPDAMRSFCERMLGLLEVFLYKERDEYDYLEYLHPEIADAAERRAWAEAFYERERQRRAEDPNRYSDKWATDYFTFAFYHDNFQRIYDKIKDFDVFLVLDSY